MSYRGRASYNRAPNCASRNTKPYIVTSGANTSLHTLYPPNVSHQEITNLLYTAIYGTFPFS